MSTKVIKSIGDFVRFGMDVDVQCSCGHYASFDARMVARKFSEKRWYTGLNDGYSMGDPYTRFRCTKCGRRPKHIGPMLR